MGVTIAVFVISKFLQGDPGVIPGMYTEALEELRGCLDSWDNWGDWFLNQLQEAIESRHDIRVLFSGSWIHGKIGVTTKRFGKSADEEIRTFTVGPEALLDGLNRLVLRPEMPVVYQPGGPGMYEMLDSLSRD